MSTAFDDDYGSLAGRRRRPWLTVFLIAVVAFLCGLAAMGWLLGHWTRAREEILGPVAEPVAVLTPAPPQVTGVLGPNGPVLAPQPSQSLADETGLASVDQRVSALEDRIETVDRRAGAAIGNASRAEGLLLAVATRRALDRGVALGYLEGLLRDRFGKLQPRAIATVIAAGRQPVTIDSLRAGLEEIAPRLVNDPQREGWWTSFRRELGNLVVVRRSDVPSSDPADRLTRAEGLIDDGQVDRALAEVNRLPGRAEASAWMAAARRYIAARDALDSLETSALLDPGTPDTAQTAAPAVGTGPG